MPMRAIHYSEGKNKFSVQYHNTHDKMDNTGIDIWLYIHELVREAVGHPFLPPEDVDGQTFSPIRFRHHH